MTLLVGNSVEQATASTRAKEKSLGCSFSAAATGTVEVIKCIIKSGAAETELDIGIYEDSAGKPGKRLAHKKTGKLAASTTGTVEATAFSVAVTKGTTYWLVADPLPATAVNTTFKYLKEAGHEEVQTNATAWAELKEGSEGTWSKVVESTKMSIWAEGVETGGTSTAQCKTQVTLVGKAAPTDQMQGQGKTRIQVVDTLSARMIAQAQEQAKVQFQQQTTAQTSIRCGVVAQYQFQDHAAVEVMSKVQALTKLRLTDAATANAIMQVGARAKIVVTSNASAQQIQQVAGSARLVFAGEAHAIASGAEAARHVAIFIFEE